MSSFFRMVKMDFYRMIRMKIVWFVFAGIAVITAAISLRYSLQINDLKQSGFSTEYLNKKYSVTVIDAAVNGQKITVWDISGITFSPLILIFGAGIFIPFFINQESQNGFLKSIGNLVPNRGIIAASKLYSIMVYSVFSIGVNFLSSCIFSKILFGYVYLGGENTITNLQSFGLLFIWYLTVNFLLAVISIWWNSVNAIVIIGVFAASGIHSLFSMGVCYILQCKNQAFILISGLLCLFILAFTSILIMAKRDV